MRRTLFLELLRQQFTVALIPIVLIGGVAYQMLFPRLTDELRQNRQTLALSVGEQVEARLASSEDHLKLIALDIINNPNAASLANRLDAFVQVSDIFEAIYVTGMDGKIDHIGLPIADISTRRLFQDMDVSFTALSAEQQPLEPGRYYWSNVFVSPISGQQSVALFTAIGTSHLIAEIDLRELPSLSQRLSRGDIMVLLLDDKATLIAHPDMDISQQQFSLGYASLFTENMASLRTGTFVWNNIEQFATVVPLSATRWQVVVSQPLTSFNATIQYLTVIWLLLAGATFAITAFIAYRTAVRESKPITELQAMTEAVSQGNYDVPRIETHIDEFESVSNAFIAMASRIQSRERELNDLNTELEGRVAERTAELMSINEALTNSVLRLETTMEQLVQSEKLASLGSLVAGIAHELNTPIGNAKIAVTSQQDYIRDVRQDLEQGRLTKSLLDQFMEDIDSTADMALRNMNRASDLIRSFKQVAVDQTSSNLRTFNLATVINEVLVTLRPTLKRSPVHVETQVPANIDMHSLPGSVSQVLTNLINNAVHHGLSENHKSLTIHISAEIRDDLVLLTVRDDGVGMPAENIKRAFDPFFTTKMGQGGSGLGLNIVHRMVRGMLKGNIELTSTEGLGTTFVMTLPRDVTGQLSASQANVMMNHHG